MNVFKVKTKHNMTSFWCFYCWPWPESVCHYSVSTFNFLQAFVSRVWKTSHVLKTQKVTYLFRNKSCKAFFIQRVIIAPNWNKLWTNDHTMNIFQGRRKLFYGGGGGWIKMSVAMVGRSPKTKSSSQKRNLDQNIDDSKSHITNSFFENIATGMQRFYIRPHVSVDIIRIFFSF